MSYDGADDGYGPSANDPAERCALCDRLLYVKLSRKDGALRRDVYCSPCDALPGTVDVTASAGRRAARVAFAAREVAEIAQGAA